MSAYRVPADARAAASLLLLRDGAAGPEVLLMRRAERDGDYRSGLCVFPGGVLDARDPEAHAWVVGDGDAAWSARLGVAEGGLDYAVAALRECFEEVGLLLADRPFDAVAAAAWRRRLHAGEVGIADVCAALGVKLDLRTLSCHSHWLTPPGVPKRFDTRFFAAAAPVGQQAEVDGNEAVELMWLTPQAALDPARGLKLLPVTERTLQELLPFADAASALAASAARRDIRLTMPRGARLADGRRTVLMPEHPAWAEAGRLDPEGRGDVFADLVAGRAVRLSPRIVRVTAPNPGLMTGPGTNSYLVGAGDAWTVIDPGPADERHLQALLAAAPGRIERILVTHTHRDHSPGAAALAAATGATVVGRRPEFHDGQDTGFRPDHEPADGERLDCGGAVLRVLATPGHASNHLCFLLEDEDLLFTGDHVMQGSTVVINPPDGDMTAYLVSLERLRAAPPAWLAPGHGFLVAEPQAVFDALIRHRLRREQRVLRALAQRGDGDLDSLLPEVYADVPALLHAPARRSLLAHLLKLAADGQAASDDGLVWRYVGPGSRQAPSSSSS
ncbi:MBL fold metallo-hydrolase [Rubrivivax benzoatilyticus]|uniref:MBL fold metallo-hydrolase n=1 Tax=Rubrivivax benzoatilyticus TaxID=316997 RepID=A0ABX0HZA9_9BURK|nr:MBL fold metallo-hydrolase [Rubrivivax benzoatilyticus]EGJ08976.1 NUDIX hydrolase:Beta-lactamase-like protein [Rubrivivax benzoatilyticus JA2 = ATCC BAA-35]NHL00323.1 MBL fold metallo-hydrolase [Rubrivivax benzoatilyticus]NHL26195.1 MBL fold metallo-hydrolase [Rubrivivax benzoatilyticus]